MFRPRLCLWFCYYSLCLRTASYQYFLVLGERTSSMLCLLVPVSFGRDVAASILLNFAYSATLVTHGQGCPAVPVSCSGGTAGITNSYVFCLW
jgi:hypothetical protein